ncbi:MEDS domain-containing protein [Spirillospora sp. NBC_01491]|uniref:MEDS domain-containing protein n=1 Tax=Spirillospora sp. NBC_01491 TaxID=2976007 RepID=UPI002E2EB02D|nr:MEDS domain-containing protein [Spirillospora sp. NBC_01491]
METSWFAKRPVSDIRPGDHGWLAYTGLEERDRVIGIFVGEGLETGEKVVYVSDRPAGRLPGLGGRPPDELDELARSGRLRVIPRRAACLDRSGGFEPAKMLDTLAREVGEAFGQGLRAVRLTTDHSRLLNEPGRPGLARMLGCEHRLGEAVSPSTMVKAICQVDRQACRPDELTALRDTHEVLVEVNPEFDDGVLKIVRTFDPVGLRVEGELDAARHAVFSDRLAQVSAGRGGVHLDFSRLGFIDLGCLNLLAHHAIALPRGQALVLDNLPPDVETVIELVGWHRLPGLARGRDRVPAEEGAAR